MRGTEKLSFFPYFVADIPFISSIDVIDNDTDQYLLSDDELVEELNKYQQIDERNNVSIESSGSEYRSFLERQLKILYENLYSLNEQLEDTNLETLKPVIGGTITDCERQIAIIEEKLGR